MRQKVPLQKSKYWKLVDILVFSFSFYPPLFSEQIINEKATNIPVQVSK